MDKPFDKWSLALSPLPPHCIHWSHKIIFKDNNLQTLQNPVEADLPCCNLSTSHAILHPFSTSGDPVDSSIYNSFIQTHIKPPEHVNIHVCKVTSILSIHVKTKQLKALCCKFK